ncbi:TadE/TadG family type IV pilus assembly protein [Roseomonas sp. CAU 1739]|uniref:TadE/TadG family type IV pilus assembly protein n=1 Tax=Roseomonas sp. CAU 1739 TaxID=3140364 RepID=UPI00325B1F12
MRRGLLRGLRDRRGVAALEFVLILPVLTLIMITTADLGNALQQSIRLETAARAGAQYAFSYPSDTTGITDQVRNSLTGWPVGTGITIPTPTLRCVCPGNASVTCANEDVCTVTTQQFITVSVTRSHTPLLLTPFTTLQGRAEVRLR